MSTLGWLLQPAVLPWAALALGLCIGSFLNVVIHRLPKMMEREWRAECAALAGQEPPTQEPYNLVVPRSRCPGCGHAITALENIPLASYLALRGKCSACGARIGVKYPVVELLAGLAAAYSAWPSARSRCSRRAAAGTPGSAFISDRISRWQAWSRSTGAIPSCGGTCTGCELCDRTDRRHRQRQERGGRGVRPPRRERSRHRRHRARAHRARRRGAAAA